MTPRDTNATMAVFLDLENIALGVRDAHYPTFDIEQVLERLLLKGHIVVKKAYCDFERYREYKKGLHGAAFELIEIPHLRQSGKNSADIRMVVDALDLCYTKGHVDTFVIISGDSDFSPLVSKLRENAKTVIGVGVKNSTSDLFLKNCDEFLYYDDFVRHKRAKSRTPASAQAAVPAAGAQASSPAAARTGKSEKSEARSEGKPEKPEGKAEPKKLDPAEAFDLVVETLEALTEERDENERIWASMIKEAIKRRNPGFNERAYGFRSFSDLLLEAQKRGLIRLFAERSGGYIVRTIDSEYPPPPPPADSLPA